MNTMRGRSYTLVILFFLMIPSTDAVAFINFDTTIEFFEESVFGTCTFDISDLEPYAAMNTDCQMTRDGQQVALKQLPGVQLGWPRPANSILSKVWFLTSLFPQADKEYCMNFYDVDGQYGPTHFLLAHHDNHPEESIIGLGVSTCETAEAEAKAYFQQFCWGGFTNIYSVALLVPGIHFSFRFNESPFICWAVAVEGSQ